jgi:sulfide dehydrogenase cytochrome subunit
MIEGGTQKRVAAGRRLMAVGALLLCAACQSTAERQPRGGNPEVADPTSAAALMAASCSGCHVGATTTDGVPAVAGTLPAIEGLTAAEITDALRAFRDGSRAGTLMPRIARGYDESEIQFLSEYLGR